MHTLISYKHLDDQSCEIVVVAYPFAHYTMKVLYAIALADSNRIMIRDLAVLSRPLNNIQAAQANTCNGKLIL